MDDIFDFNEVQMNPLDEFQTSMNPIDDDILGNTMGNDGMSPFDSGFNDTHPFPTYDQLRNAGFSDHVANSIVYGDTHSYSQRELFHCLYESDDPLAAYNEMMHAKVEKSLAESEALINRIESSL